MSITVTPILPRFGAEVSGIDITGPLSEASKREIIDIQNRWGVTVWRDTGLDDDSHVAFTRIFGDVILAPKTRGRPRFAHPELFDASNLDADGNIVDDEHRRLTNRGNRLWHSDSSFVQERAAQSLLLCHEAPNGGPTWFADTRSAYDDLPQAMKDRLEGLEARHCYFWSRRRAGYPYTEEEVDRFPHSVHPVVHVHAGSGRKALYLGAHARDIVGMDREEGCALIEELNDWVARPDYIFPVEYRPGDMVIWDNLCSYHRAGDFDEFLHRRDMRRTTIRDPQAPDSGEGSVQAMFSQASQADGRIAGLQDAKS